MEQIAIFLIQHETEPNSLFIENGSEVRTDGLYIELLDGKKMDDLKFGEFTIMANLKIGSSDIYHNIPVDMAVYIIVAIHGIIKHSYRSELVHFFTYIELAVLKLVGKVYTSKSRKLHKEVM